MIKILYSDKSVTYEFDPGGRLSLSVSNSGYIAILDGSGFCFFKEHISALKGVHLKIGEHTYYLKKLKNERK